MIMIMITGMTESGEPDSESGGDETITAGLSRLGVAAGTPSRPPRTRDSVMRLRDLGSSH
jgi:hypothetical protein